MFAQAFLDEERSSPSPFFHGTSKPYTRWWWLAGPFRREAIRDQLVWARDNGFGGVELAWLWPHWLDHAWPGIAWLGPEWRELIVFTKQEADRLGLGCDFSFGSCWPFGGTLVPPEDASRTFDGLSPQRLDGSWEAPETGRPFVLNHLDQEALRRYAQAMMPAYAPALEGSRSALFYDSLEMDTRRLWDPKLWARFAEKSGYRLEGIEHKIDDDAGVRYDYRTVIAEAIVRECYAEFTAICHEHGAVSRVQCHGAPADLLSAYAAVDVPESESILFDPPFSRIAASAAALSGKPVVSSETFTCLYGFVTPSNLEPLDYWHREQVADMKLLADALFAQGVNHIVWHGMPFNEPGGAIEFYASVHVGPDAGFADDLPAFNGYLERVSALMKLGRAESRLAVYLPNEDNWRRGRIPDDERTPGAGHRWEMRHVVVPRETESYAPMWISHPFLSQAEVVDGRLCVGPCSFSALYIDVDWLDVPALDEIHRLAEAGLPVVLGRTPKAPGRHAPRDYEDRVEELRARPNVHPCLADAGAPPLVTGADLPPFWARRTADALLLFFAHPKARDLHYPMRYGQSRVRRPVVRRAEIEFQGMAHPVELVFDRQQSYVVRVTSKHGAQIVDTSYEPPEPVDVA